MNELFVQDFMSFLCKVYNNGRNFVWKSFSSAERKQSMEKPAKPRTGAHDLQRKKRLHLQGQKRAKLRLLPKTQHKKNDKWQSILLKVPCMGNQA